MNRIISVLFQNSVYRIGSCFIQVHRGVFHIPFHCCFYPCFQSCVHSHLDRQFGSVIFSLLHCYRIDRTYLFYIIFQDFHLHFRLFRKAFYRTLYCVNGGSLNLHLRQIPNYCFLFRSLIGIKHFDLCRQQLLDLLYSSSYCHLHLFNRRKAFHIVFDYGQLQSHRPVTCHIGGDIISPNLVEVCFRQIPGNVNLFLSVFNFYGIS